MVPFECTAVIPAGFRAWLKNCFPLDGCARILQYLRPLLLSGEQPTQTLASTPAQEELYENEGDIEPAPPRRPTAASTLPLLAQWSESLLLSMEHHVPEVGNGHECGQFLHDVRSEFPVYEPMITDILAACRHESQVTLQRYLQVERGNSTSFSMQACGCFNVIRKTMRRYMRECQVAVRHRGPAKDFGIGEFSFHADLLEDLLQYRRRRDDVSFALMNKLLPSAVSDVQQARAATEARPQPAAKQNIPTRARKGDLREFETAEHFEKKERGGVYVSSRVGDPERTVADCGDKSVDELWEFAGFRGVYKSLPPFPYPVSEAEARVCWLSYSSTWGYFLTWWNNGGFY